MKRLDVMTCYSMSGWNGVTIITWTDGADLEVVSIGENRKSSQRVLRALCGPGVSDPAVVSRFCSTVEMTDNIYICPVHSLSEGSAVPSSDLDVIFGDRDDVGTSKFSQFREADSKHPGDEYGLLARTVGAGNVVLNRIKSSYKTGLFYDSLLATTGTHDYVIMSSNAFDRFFPYVDYRYRSAAMRVPVRFSTPQEIADKYDLASVTVDVLVASDYIPGVVPFIALYNVLTSREVVLATRSFEIEQGLVATKNGIGLIA